MSALTIGDIAAQDGQYPFACVGYASLGLTPDEAAAVWKTYKVCVLKKKYELDCPRMHQSPVEYAHSLVSTAGVLMFAILSLVLGYYVIDGDSSLYLVKIVMSVITMGFGLYALSRGIATEGMMMYAVAMITIVTSAAHIVHIPDTEYLGMVVSFVFIPLAYRFAREGDWMMSIASALLFAMFFLGPFVSDAAYLEVIVAVLKAVSCVMAIHSASDCVLHISPMRSHPADTGGTSHRNRFSWHPSGWLLLYAARNPALP